MTSRQQVAFVLLTSFGVAPVSSWTPVTTMTSFSQVHAFDFYKTSSRASVTALFSTVDYEDKTLTDSSLLSSTSTFSTPSTSMYQAPPDMQEQRFHVDELTQKLTNGLLLAASFGYAAYTVLNIDHGMTRGWTQSEIAMRIPLDNWGAYESALQEFPVYTKTLINVVIYLLGDWLSQTLFQKKNALDFDAWRVLRNGFIGLCFGPLVHEYYQWSDHILPPDGGLFIRLQKILMDQTIYLTIKCSIYIMAVGLLQGDSFETAKKNVQDRIKDIVLTAWKFWPLVHCITYGVIPARHRILWVNSVDLIWNAILATLSRKTEAKDNVFVGVPQGDEPKPESELSLEMLADQNAHEYCNDKETGNLSNLERVSVTHNVFNPINSTVPVI